MQCFRGAPMQCDLSVLVTLQATSQGLSHTQTSIHKSMANNHKTQLQHAGHEPVCLVPEWMNICLCLPGLFKSALTLILRALYSADVDITTASCDGPTMFVTELVDGSSFHQFDLKLSPRFIYSQQLAICQHSANHCCNTC